MRQQLADAVEGLRSGTPESLGDAIEKLQGTVYSFSMKVCGHREDAEDTMQDVLMRSLPHLRKIKNARAMAVWLYTVTRNRCWSKRRKGVHAPSAVLSLDELMPDAPEMQRLLADKNNGPEEQLLRSETSERVRDAVLTLPPQYRLVLVLHDMEEMDAELVARILKLKPGTVRVRLHRARLALRKALAERRVREAGKSVKARPKKEKAKCSPQCKAIFANLSEYMDGRLRPQSCESIRRHMEGCPACAAFLEDLGRAIEGCKTVETPCNRRVQVRLRALLTAEYLRLAQGSRTGRRKNNSAGV